MLLKLDSTYDCDTDDESADDWNWVELSFVPPKGSLGAIVGDYERLAYDKNVHENFKPPTAVIGVDKRGDWGRWGQYLWIFH